MPPMASWCYYPVQMTDLGDEDEEAVCFFVFSSSLSPLTEWGVMLLDTLSMEESWDALGWMVSRCAWSVVVAMVLLVDCERGRSPSAGGCSSWLELLGVVVFPRMRPIISRRRASRAALRCLREAVEDCLLALVVCCCGGGVWSEEDE